MAKKHTKNFIKTVTKKNRKLKRSRRKAKFQKQQANKDIHSKVIFHNPVLCSQFLRDHINIPLMKHIRPEDIEDCTERFNSYFGVEYEADTVKRIHIRNNNEELEFYLISLIDHKSRVDYNVVVQLLKYMTCIWAEYEKQFGANYKDQVKTKTFRYPPILPIVYYEGEDKWTAAMHLKERIFMHELFEAYIPDFTYYLVNVHEFSNTELLERNDEMSLIMLLNKIQNSTELSEFLSLPSDALNEILEQSPEAVIDIIVMVIQALCTRLNASKEETDKCVEKVRSHNMGYLWENMEKMDIQAERRNTAEARAELEQAQRKLQDTQTELQDSQAEVARLKAVLASHGISPK